MSLKKWLLKRKLRKIRQRNCLQDLSVNEEALKECISDCFLYSDDPEYDCITCVTVAFDSMRKARKITCRFSESGALEVWLYKFLTIKYAEAKKDGKAKCGTVEFTESELRQAIAVFYGLFTPEEGEEPFAEFEPEERQNLRRITEEYRKEISRKAGENP